MKLSSICNGTGDSQALKQWPKLPSSLLLKAYTQQHEFCIELLQAFLGEFFHSTSNVSLCGSGRYTDNFPEVLSLWVFSVNLQGMLFLPTAPLVSQPQENEGCRKEDEFGVVLVSLMQGDRVQQKHREARSGNFRGKKKIILRVFYDLLGLCT